jgi:hypothetical protein
MATPHPLTCWGRAVGPAPGPRATSCPTCAPPPGRVMRMRSRKMCILHHVPTYAPPGIVLRMRSNKKCGYYIMFRPLRTSSRYSVAHAQYRKMRIVHHVLTCAPPPCSVMRMRSRKMRILQSCSDLRTSSR